MAKMKAPEGSTSCGFNGETYEVDKKGFVTVPAEAVGDLMAHGFVPVGATDDNDAKVQAEADKKKEAAAAAEAEKQSEQ